MKFVLVPKLQLRETGQEAGASKTAFPSWSLGTSAKENKLSRCKSRL